MKWTISQLKKMQYQNNEFEKTIDFTSFIPEDEDIIDIKPTNVKVFFEIEDDAYYHFDLEIDTVLIMACAKTLKPVNVPLHIEVTETFTFDEEDDYRTIEGITIDLLPIIWSNIYLEKPLRVVHKDAQNKDFDKPEENDSINPYFKDLNKLKS